MKKLFFFLFCILLLASVFRLYKLGSIPEGFHADEAAFGYNAYSLLQTGADEYGKPFPVIMKSFGDYKGALYSYLVIPFIRIFGLNEYAVRLPSALSGIILVYLTFVLARELSKKNTIALLAALLCAISPIAIFISRETEPALLAMVLMMGGLIGLFRWKDKGKASWFMVSVICFALSLVTYFIPRLFLLVIIPLFWLDERLFLKKRQALYLLLLYFVTVVSVLFLFFGPTGSRFGQVSVFNSNHVMLPLQEKIREDGVRVVPSLVARVFHNKIGEYGRFLLHNYTQYFSFNYLFFEAEQPRREVIPGMGVIYLASLPFLLYGIYMVFHKKLRWGYFVVAWFFIVPALLSFATDETPNIHRFIVNVFPINLLGALGIYELLLLLKQGVIRRYAVVLVLVLYCVNMAYFIDQLFIHQPVHFPFYRGFAYKELIAELPAYYPKYQKIIVTKGNESPYIYFLFFGAYDPKSYQLSGSHRDLDYQGFDKYEFVPYDCPSFNESREVKSIVDNTKTLLVRRGGCQLGLNDKLLVSVPWRGGSEAFQLVEYAATVSASVFNQK